MDKLIYYSNDDFSLNEDTVVTIGNFDGFHKGHMQLIHKMEECKNKFNLKSVMMSFEPHPVEVFRKQVFKLLFTAEEKKLLAESFKIDILVHYPFSIPFSQTAPEAFIRDVLKDKLNAKFIVVGESYKFGKNNQGDISTLKQFEDKYGYKTMIVPHYDMHRKKVSSSLIRESISKGNIESANNMLGKAYFIEEEVVSGKKLGRTIGFPTINMIPDKRKLLPGDGVYVTKVIIDGKEYMGATNVGNNPTVNGEKTTVETFILDYCKDAYGKVVRVIFLKKLRDTYKMSGIDELQKVIKADEKAVRKYFSETI